MKVEARLTTIDPEVLNAAVKDGTALELVFLPVGTDGDGNEVVSFGFAPAPTNAKEH